MSVPGVASRAADRFYCPPPRRHLLEKQQRQHQPLAAAAPVEEPAKPTPELRWDAPAPPPPPPAAATAATNLESFIASTAVRVPARGHPRTGTRGRGPGADAHEGTPYYELADLWDAFGEWSAYGAGVPLLLNGTDGVVQYYVPFLSAIQLYGSRPPPPSKRYGRWPLHLSLGDLEWRFNEDSDDDSALDTSNDVSSVSDNERNIGIPTQCLAEDISIDREGFSDDSMLTGRPETNNFHNNKIADVPGKITLPLIGLVSYKFHGSMWMSNQHHEQKLTTSLLKAADDWLCQRQVDHPDFRFFLSH
nr:unnamed protein product [Digitaria exilis]